MRAQKTWVIGILGSVAIFFAGQSTLVGATSAIYFDEKGNSHALDENLKNPFDAKSKEGKLVDAFLAELKKYKLCKIIFDGDTTSSTADLEKKIDKDTQAATAAHNAKAAATSKAEQDFEKGKAKAKTEEEEELRKDKEKEDQELQNAAKDQKEAIKSAHKEARDQIKKKYRNKDKTGVVDELEKKKKAAIDAANATPPAELKLTCGASEECGDNPCKEKSLGKDPGEEGKLKEAPVPKILYGIAPNRIFFCTCGKK